MLMNVMLCVSPRPVWLAADKVATGDKAGITRSSNEYRRCRCYSIYKGSGDVRLSGSFGCFCESSSCWIWETSHWDTSYGMSPLVLALICSKPMRLLRFSLSKCLQFTHSWYYWYRAGILSWFSLQAWTNSVYWQIHSITRSGRSPFLCSRIMSSKC